MFGTHTCFVAVWSFQLWLCAGAEGLLEELELELLPPMLVLLLPELLELVSARLLFSEDVSAFSASSTSTSLSAESCFFSSDALVSPLSSFSIVSASLFSDVSTLFSTFAVLSGLSAVENAPVAAAITTATTAMIAMAIAAVCGL
nr:hypothetical protein [Bilophila wadsworthia]